MHVDMFYVFVCPKFTGTRTFGNLFDKLIILVDNQYMPVVI